MRFWKGRIRSWSLRKILKRSDVSENDDDIVGLGSSWLVIVINVYRNSKFFRIMICIDTSVCIVWLYLHL